MYVLSPSVCPEQPRAATLDFAEHFQPMILGMTTAYVHVPRVSLLDTFTHCCMCAKCNYIHDHLWCFAVCSWYVNSAVSVHTDASTALLCQYGIRLLNFEHGVHGANKRKRTEILNNDRIRSYTYVCKKILTCLCYSQPLLSYVAPLPTCERCLHTGTATRQRPHGGRSFRVAHFSINAWMHTQRAPAARPIHVNYLKIVTIRPLYHDLMPQG